MNTPLRIQLFVLLVLLVGSCDMREKRRLLSFRKLAKIFVRYNIKTNIVPYTSTFAYAMGFRGNWDIQPEHVLSADSRTSLYTVYHQRALHDTIRKTLDWHGLNGDACLVRAICEAKLNYNDDVISKAYNLLFHKEESFSCPESIECPISLLHLLDNTINV